MTATARSLEITSEDIEAAEGGSYAALVPGDYEARLDKVEDYDNREKGGSFGWVWHFVVEGLPFRTWTAFSKAARWKLMEVLEAFDPTLVEEGLHDINPNEFVGMVVGVTIDFQEDPDTVPADEPNYKEIKYVFPLVSAPSESPAPL